MKLIVVLSCGYFVDWSVSFLLYSPLSAVSMFIVPCIVWFGCSVMFFVGVSVSVNAAGAPISSLVIVSVYVCSWFVGLCIV